MKRQRKQHQLRQLSRWKRLWPASLRHCRQLRYLRNQFNSVNWILNMGSGEWCVKSGKNGTSPYIIPNHPGAPIKLVVLSALKMGWTFYPWFLNVASETAHDVVESYAQERVGTLPEHPLEGSTMSELIGLKNVSMWGTNEWNKFLTLLEEKPFYTMLELFCNDFIHMAQTSDPSQLLHLSRAFLHGIHSVFPPPQVSGHNGEGDDF